MARNKSNKKQKVDHTNKPTVDPHIEKDDAEIKYYERKLGMKLKTSQNSFYKDGLGDLLEFCDKPEDKLLDYELDDEKPEEIKQSEFEPSSKRITNKFEKSKKKSEEDEQENSELDEIDSELDESESEDSKSELEDNESESEDNDTEINKPSTTKWVSKRLLENKRKFELEQAKKNKDESEDELKGYDDDEFNSEPDENDSIDDDEMEFSESERTKIQETKIRKSKTATNLKEDIYGRLIDEKGQIVKEEIKRNFIGDSQIEKELTKKIRGLMNRMTLKNLPFIFNELERIFQKHSNNLICRCLFNCIDQLVIRDQIMAPQNLCTEIAMLIAICHSRIGEEVSANILHQLVRTLDDMFKQLKDSSTDFTNNKELENLLMILCLLYGVNIITDELIYNILDKLADIFNTKAIELILFCLKLVGYLLRKDSTSMMKSLIVNIQQKANSFDKDQINEKKVMFMLNALTSIKNNVSLKMDLSDIQSIVSIDKQTIKNDLKSLFKDINVSCLKGKYNEILKSNRWFVHSGELLEISMKRKIEKQKEISIPTLNDQLCKKLQLTTPFRKLIFNTIFTCEDYIECSQNIIKATKKDHFEVILVCLHICLSEKQFNLFYIHLLRYLAHIDRNYKRGILFNLRDKIKNFDNLNSNQKTNLEKIIVELIKLNILPLIVFDVIDFKDMTESYKTFMCNILESLFKEDLSELDAIFKRLPKKSQLSTSIKLFISIFLSEDCKLKMKKLKSGTITINKIF